MTDPRIFDRTPRREFADRLEAQFLKAAAVTATAPDPTPHHSSPQEATVTLQLDDPITTERRRPTWQWPAVAAAAVLLIVALVAVLTRNSDDDDTPPAAGTPVTFTVTWEYSDVRSECTPSNECLNHFDIPATTTFSGDVKGQGLQALYWNDPVDYPGKAVDHLEHVGTYQLDATVAGCGSGQFVLVEFMQFVSGPDRDRDSGTYIGTWQIVPNSGRGALSTIAGSGTSTGNFGTAPQKGRAFAGNVTCSAAG